MPEIGEVARITTLGGKRVPQPGPGGAGSFPNVTEGRDVMYSAWLVWAAVRERVNEEKDPERRSHDGVEGFIWRGVVSHIHRSLWPAVDPAYAGADASRATADHVQTVLNKYNRDTNNLVCIDRGARSSNTEAAGTSRLPTWWVRSVWNESTPQPRTELPPTYAERRLTQAEAGEDRPAAPVTVVSAQPEAESEPAPEQGAPEQDAPSFACGHCERVFANQRGLSQHVAAHERTEPAVCPQCGREFLSETGLGQHTARHATYDKIVEEAARLLAQGNGDADAVTMNDVGEAVGYSQGASVYNHFESKAQMIAAARDYLKTRADAPSTPTAPADAGQPPQDDAATTALAAKFLAVIAAAAREDIPLSATFLQLLGAGYSTPQRAAAIDHLLEHDLVRTERRPSTGRVYTAYLPHDGYEYPHGAPTAQVDPMEALRAVLAEHDELKRRAQDAEAGAAQAAEHDRRVLELEDRLAEMGRKFAVVKDLFSAG